MKEKIFKYINGRFIWWWTRHYKPTYFLDGGLKKYVTDSYNFGIEPTIENYLKGKVSLMAMIEKQIIL